MGLFCVTSVVPTIWYHHSQYDITAKLTLPLTDEYEASRWRLGLMNGTGVFLTPSVPGRYRITLVRDRKLILRAMEKGPRRDAFKQQCKRELSEDLISLGHTDFTVRVEDHNDILQQEVPPCFCLVTLQDCVEHSVEYKHEELEEPVTAPVHEVEEGMKLVPAVDKYKKSKYKTYKCRRPRCSARANSLEAQRILLTAVRPI